MRRVFLQRGEIAGLLRGALLGHATSLRRILGARRAGRIGSTLALGAAALAIPPADLAWPLLAHLVLSILGPRYATPSAGIGARQYQRIALWALAATLALSLPHRLMLQLGVGLEGGAVPVLAVLCAHLALWNGLREDLSA